MLGGFDQREIGAVGVGVVVVVVVGLVVVMEVVWVGLMVAG